MISIRQAKCHAWETCLRDMTHTSEASSETRTSKREISLYDIYIYMICIHTWGDARGLGLVPSGAQALWPAHYSNHNPWRIDNMHTRRISSMISLFLLPPHPLCAIHIGGPRGQGGSRGPKKSHKLFTHLREIFWCGKYTIPDHHATLQLAKNY